MKSLKEILQASGDLYPDVTPKGWECPKCGRVYSPSTPMCLYCGGEQTTTVTSKTGGNGIPTVYYDGRPPKAGEGCMVVDGIGYFKAEDEVTE